MRPSVVTILLILALLVGLAGARPTVVAGAGPTLDAPRQVRIEAGTHVGLRFDADWDVIASRKVSLQRPSAAHATGRRWISGRGTYLAIADGTFAGYWVRESMVAYVTGTVASRRYEPVRRVSFPAGTVAGYRFDARTTPCTTATW